MVDCSNDEGLTAALGNVSSGTKKALCLAYSTPLLVSREIRFLVLMVALTAAHCTKTPTARCHGLAEQMRDKHEIDGVRMPVTVIDGDERVGEDITDDFWYLHDRLMSIGRTAAALKPA